VKQNDTAIFLHRIPYSESSLITTFYTLHSGTQKFLFQGGKKKSAALFPASICEITFYRRPDSELGKLTEAQPLNSLRNIQVDPVRSTITFFIAAILKNCLKTDQSDPQLFHFLEEKISVLNTCDLNLLPLYPIEFLVSFAMQMGIEPQVPSKISRYFHLEEGEFSDVDQKGELVAEGPGVELIQMLLTNELKHLPERSARSEAFETMLSYYKLHIPGFNVDQSLEILREILYK
jgi:DNA repair protein RecO (recombination protein O)